MVRTPVHEIDSGASVDVWVVPGASRSTIVGLHGDRLKIRVAAPAEGGRANAEATRLLGEKLGAPVVLIRGMDSRQKVFEVAGLDVGTVVRKLGIDV